jgi:hypothetical protein
MIFSQKKDKISYRLVNAIIEINRVTIRDINMFPSADEFAEEFSKYTVISLINFFICKPVKLLRALGAGFAGLQNQHYAVF